MNKYHYYFECDIQTNEAIGLCKEFPFLSAFAKTPDTAIKRIKLLVKFNVEWMIEDGEKLPEVQNQTRPKRKINYDRN